MIGSTFVINLASRPDRLSKFINNQPNPGLEVYTAVEDKIHPNYGCLMSHYNILRLSKVRGDAYTLIFEDDAVLNKTISQMRQSICDIEVQCPNWEILLFSVSQGSCTQECLMLSQGVEVIKLKDEFNGTYAMVVSSRAYDKLISKMSKAYEYKQWNVDIDVYSKVCSCIYLTVPFMCYVIVDQSSIRTYDTTGDLDQIKLCESRLLLQTSFMNCNPS
jgi:GR25 family glycosyltransferase involved in LPS biosynthesis